MRSFLAKPEFVSASGPNSQWAMWLLTLWSSAGKPVFRLTAELSKQIGLLFWAKAGQIESY